MSAQTRGSSEQGSPRGRAAVENALIEATERLCTESSPAVVSIRDIADEAGVNHGQVHHYFGSKQALIVRTVEQIDDWLLERIGAWSEWHMSALVKAVASRPAFLRMIAWLVLEHVEPAEVESIRFGRVLISRLTEEGWEESEARVAVTEVMIRAGGWALLSPILTTVNELRRRDVDAVQARLSTEIESLLSSERGDHKPAARSASPG